jgi:hypothetical protein
MFGDLSSLMKTHNKTAFKIGQASAVAQATIDTYASAVSAYKSLVGIPVFGPALAIAGASSAIIAGMINIAQIKSQTLPEAQEGGIIRPSRAGTLLRAGENNRAEAIIPFENPEAMDKLRGMGTTINVYVENLMSEDGMPEKVARRIDEALYTLKRRNQSISFA